MRVSSPSLLLCILALLGASFAGASEVRDEITLPLEELWRVQPAQTTLDGWRSPHAGNVAVVPAGRAVEGRDLGTGAIHWRTELATSVRTAALVGNQLYVGGIVGTDDGIPVPDFHALDPATGRVLWSATLGGVFAVPVAHQGRLVIASTHVIASLLETGEVVWLRRFPRDASGFPGGPAQAGVACVGDLVITGAGDLLLHAFDATDGSARWSLPLSHRLLAPPATTGDAVVVATGRTLRSLSAIDGTERWRVLLAGDPGFSAPVNVGDTIYVGTGAAGTVVAIEVASGHLEWETRIGPEVSATPAITTDLVIVGDRNGALHALDRASGRRVWSGVASAASLLVPAVAGNGILVGSRAGDFALFGSAATPDAASRLLVSPNPGSGPLLIQGARGRLRFYDVQGRLVDESFADSGSFIWRATGRNGAPLPIGIYFVTVHRQEGAETAKIQLLR